MNTGNRQDLLRVVKLKRRSARRKRGLQFNRILRGQRLSCGRNRTPTGHGDSTAAGGPLYATLAVRDNDSRLSSASFGCYSVCDPAGNTVSVLANDSDQVSDL